MLAGVYKRIARMAASRSKSFTVWVLFALSGSAAIVLSNFDPASWIVFSFFGCALACGAAAVVFRDNAIARLMLVSCALFLFGAWRAGIAIPQPVAIPTQAAEFSGDVIQEPASTLGGSSATVRVPAGYDVQLSLPPGNEVVYGDRLVWFCKLQSSDRAYMLKTKVAARCAPDSFRIADRGTGNPILSSLYGLRRALVFSISHSLPEPEAGFLEGLLVGSTSSLSPELRAEFAKTGPAHVIALSGWNIGVVSLGIERLLRAFGLKKRLRLAVCAAGIVLFVLAVGASASIVRAAIMGILVVVAKASGRMGNAGIAILAAAAFMVFLNPFIITADLGFLLSFAATLGLVYIGPIIAEAAQRLPKFLNFGETFATTLSATVATLPVVLVAFGQLSLVALPTNVFLLPFLPLTMLFGFVGAVFGVIWIPLGVVFGRLSFILLKYCLAVVDLFSRVPGGSVTGIYINFGAAALMAAGIIAAVACSYPKRRVV